MIARLRGKVVEADAGRLVVDVSGVGYDVAVPESVLAEFGLAGSEVDLFVRTLVREDDISLYGFSNKVQRQLFDLLRGVQGCGAKTSLALIGGLGEATVREAVMTDDTRTLCKATGVGPKLADKIVAALRDRMVEVQVSGGGSVRAAIRAKVVPEDELAEACLALGYPKIRIDPLLEEARESAEGLQDQIRYILKRLAR